MGLCLPKRLQLWNSTIATETFHTYWVEHSWATEQNDKLILVVKRWFSWFFGQCFPLWMGWVINHVYQPLYCSRDLTEGSHPNFSGELQKFLETYIGPHISNLPRLKPWFKADFTFHTMLLNGETLMQPVSYYCCTMYFHELTSASILTPNLSYYDF